MFAINHSSWKKNKPMDLGLRREARYKFHVVFSKLRSVLKDAIAELLSVFIH